MTEFSVMALAAYRHLLRATRIAFKGKTSPIYTPKVSPQKPYLPGRLPSYSILIYLNTDDNRVLVSARRQARSDFYKNRSLLPSSPEASEKIAHAEDVARFLRQNVVQGQKVNDIEREKYRELCPR